MNSEAEVVFSEMDLKLLFINAHVMAAVVPLLSFYSPINCIQNIKALLLK